MDERGSTCVLAGIAAILLLPPSARAAEENAATQSSDAFGRTVGNERSGLYSADEVRGFNPGEAGNSRIEGLYFDFSGQISNRVSEANTVRVGLAAQRYPFPAPSGLVDYELVKPGSEAELEIEADTSGSFAKGPGLLVSLKLPILGEKLGIAGGGGGRAAIRPEGGRHSFRTWGILAAMRPAPGMEILAFSSAVLTHSIETRATYFPAGTALPPQVERGRFLGLDWTAANSAHRTHGAMANIDLGSGWRIRSGLFLSRRTSDSTYADLFLGVTPDGRGNRVVIADEGADDSIVSGEFRLTHDWKSGALAHTLTASLRGRSKHRVFGGSATLRLGSGPIASPEFWPARPAFGYAARNTDEVRQLTGGLSYSVLWGGRASFDFGITKGTYTKRIDFADPALADPVSRDQPLLWNAAASVSLSSRLIAFAGITRGQEDALIAPDVAINRSEAPPAIRTRQVEAGLRYSLTAQLALVVSAFSISRPYYNLDSGLRYRDLGTLTNRGLEFSLTGKLLPGVSLVGGLLLADPKISGEAVASGQIGQRPVGLVRRRLVANLEWRSQAGKGPLSFDTYVEAVSSRMGNVANTLVAPPRSTVNIGGRYRFRLAGMDMIFRPQLLNAFNNYGWNVSPSGGFTYTPARKVLISLFTTI